MQDVFQLSASSMVLNTTKIYRYHPKIVFWKMYLLSELAFLGYPCTNSRGCIYIYIKMYLYVYTHTSFFQSWCLMVVSKWIPQLATRNDLTDHSSPTQLAVDYSCFIVTDWGDAFPFSSCDKGRFTQIPGSPKMFCCLPVDFHCWKGWAFEHPK